MYPREQEYRGYVLHSQDHHVVICDHDGRWLFEFHKDWDGVNGWRRARQWIDDQIAWRVRAEERAAAVRASEGHMSNTNQTRKGTKMTSRTSQLFVCYHDENKFDALSSRFKGFYFSVEGKGATASVCVQIRTALHFQIFEQGASDYQMILDYANSL